MVTIGSLWLAILIAAALVWVASAIFWMVSPHHKSDFKKLPDEDAAIAALRPQNLSPGMYGIPFYKTTEDFAQPEIKEKFKLGPCGIFTVTPNCPPNMGKNVGLSFVYYLVVGVVIAYVAGRTLTPDASYLTVFRLTGTVAWAAYGLAAIPDAIWFGRPWSSIIKLQFDALVYGLLTAGVFGWQWTR